MSGRQSPVAVPRAVRVTTVLAVVIVAGVAAVVSYSHIQEVAHRAGESWRSYLVPLSVDGLVTASSMVILARRRAGVPSGWLPWIGLFGGIGASIGANVLAAEPTLVARLVAAWPAAAFAVAIELLMRQGRSSAPVGEVAATRAPVVDHPGDDSPTPHPPVGQVADQDPPEPADADPEDAAVEDSSPGPHPVGDALVDRVVAMVAAGRETGRRVGRRTVARELGVSEYQATQLLAETNGRPS